jgi:hypothetical protein
MATEQSDSMYDEIYNELNLKSTDELLEIWKSNNRKVWSGTAFKAIQKILLERLGSVPPQQGDSPEEESDPDTYYNIDRLTSLATIANILAWVLLVGYILAAGAYLYLVWKSNSGYLFAQYLAQLVYLLPGLFFFGVLRLLSESVYVLLEIAENSRAR